MDNIITDRMTLIYDRLTENKVRVEDDFVDLTDYLTQELLSSYKQDHQMYFAKIFDENELIEKFNAISDNLNDDDHITLTTYEKIIVIRFCITNLTNRFNEYNIKYKQSLSNTRRYYMDKIICCDPELYNAFINYTRV